MKALTEVEKTAWLNIIAVCENFLGNKKAENYVELVEEMLHSFMIMGINMSPKIHFFHSHLSSFPENMGAVSDEHGERFHQDIKTIQERYDGKSRIKMVADYCWFLMEETDPQSYARKAKRKKNT